MLLLVTSSMRTYSTDHKQSRLKRMWNSAYYMIANVHLCCYHLFQLEAGNKSIS